MLMRRCLWIVFLLLALPVLAARRPPKPPSVESLVDSAEKAVQSGTFDVTRDLGPLIERLRTSKDEDELDDLIDAIEELGDHEARTPAAVKAYLREQAPPALIAVAGSSAPWKVRCDALMVLRDLNVSDAFLDQAIAVANADTSPQSSHVQFRGTLLADWKDSRRRVGAAPENEPSGSSPNEQAALLVLEKRQVRVSALSLGDAARRADVEVVAALLDVGIAVDTPLVAGDTALEYAIGAGCLDSGNVGARMATISLLIARGADVKRIDDRGNSILMSALECPVPVVGQLIDAGVNLHQVNMQKLTALEIAFAKGRWEVAELLVSRGARLSAKAIDKLFFEKPTDPKKRALLDRATSK